MNTKAIVAAGVVVLGGIGANVPTVDFTPIATTYSYNCFYSQQPSSSTSTPETREITPCFKPQTGDESAGAAFIDWDGKVIYRQIPTDRYHRLSLQTGTTTDGLPTGANADIKTGEATEKISILESVFAPSATEAAIAFDTSATPQFGAAVASQTVAITLGASATLLVACSSDNGLGTVSYTYNAVAFTGTVTTQLTQTPNQFKLTCAYLVSPATGSAHNLVASRSVNTGDFYTHADSYSGTGVTGIPDATTNNQTTGTSLTGTITTIAASTWSTLYVLAGNGGLAASTGSTLRGTITNTAVGIFDSNTTKNPAGSVSMSASFTSSSQVAYIMFSFPAPVPPPIDALQAVLNGNQVLTGTQVWQ